jgi:hypothetical protein
MMENMKEKKVNDKETKRRESDEAAQRVAKRKRANVPLFLRKKPGAPKGNLQDEKDETSE